jgi:hypothetical protein
MCGMVVTVALTFRFTRKTFLEPWWAETMEVKLHPLGGPRTLIAVSQKSSSCKPGKERVVTPKA